MNTKLFGLYLELYLHAKKKQKWNKKPDKDITIDITLSDHKNKSEF